MTCRLLLEIGAERSYTKWLAAVCIETLDRFSRCELLCTILAPKALYGVVTSESNCRWRYEHYESSMPRPPFAVSEGQNVHHHPTDAQSKSGNSSSCHEARYSAQPSVESCRATPANVTTLEEADALQIRKDFITPGAAYPIIPLCPYLTAYVPGKTERRYGGQTSDGRHPWHEDDS
jgi:hypothetical protein